MMKGLLDAIPAIETLSISNRTSLEMDRPDGVFLVREGIVYVFIVETLEDGRTGNRYHIAHFGEGDVFFPMPACGKCRFMAYGTLNTSVSVIDSGAFADFCARTENLDALRKILNDWTLKITGNLRRKGEREAKANRQLAKTGEYPAHVRLFAPELVWVRADDGIYTLDGVPLADLSGGGFFPLTQRQTIYLERSRLVTVAEFGEQAGKTDLGAFFGSYGVKIADSLYAERASAIRSENERIHEKFRRADKTFSATLRKIGSVLDRREDETRFDDADFEGQYLYLAARLTARSGKITLGAIPGKAYAAGSDGIDELAKDNNVRVREVLLRGAWWKGDNGPLLGFSLDPSDDGSPSDDDGPKANGDANPKRAHPVAIIAEKAGSYRAFDPETGTSTPIDSVTAGGIAPVAYMFYRPFPNAAVSFGDLIRFAAEGLRGDAVKFAALGITGSLVGLLVPEITRVFTDSIIPEAAKNRMLQLSLLVVVCSITACAFDMIKGLYVIRMETKSDSTMQAAVMDRLIKMPAAFFRDYTAGDLSERALAISQIRRILSGTVLSSLMTFLFSLVYLAQLFRYSPTLARWGLLFCLVSILATAIVSLARYRYDKKVAELQGSITGSLLQFVMGVGKLNITGSEKRAFDVWARKFIEKKKLAFKSGYINNLYATFTAIFPVAVTTLFYFLYMGETQAGDAVGAQPLSTGTFLAFMCSFNSLESALIAMTSTLTKSVNIIPLYNRAKPILTGIPEIRTAKPSASALSGDIEISHVNFRYAESGPLILKDVSLKVDPGEFVALVGGSGSGKSTLLRLILGFEKAESGAIYFDNKDMDSLDISSVRRQMGVVLQNGSIMQGSIYKNIVGSSCLTVDDAWVAARMVGLERDIQEMPMGMFTELSAGGGTLSGGQRQRLIIARAIIRKPKILIFDEATSALDNRTQAVVSESLESMNVTRIVIAHRLSTIVKADTIYVLQDGAIEEHGTYGELMERKKRFYELAIRQQI